MGTSNRISCCCTANGIIIADKPRINRTLKILLPTTLPTAMSACPCHAEEMLTASSGALVPRATTVRPTIRGEMPRDPARWAGAFYQHTSAPIVSSTRPITKSPRVTMSMLSDHLHRNDSETWKQRHDSMLASKIRFVLVSRRRARKNQTRPCPCRRVSGCEGVSTWLTLLPACRCHGRLGSDKRKMRFTTVPNCLLSDPVL
jgi:hypothetical protein